MVEASFPHSVEQRASSIAVPLTQADPNSEKDVKWWGRCSTANQRAAGRMLAGGNLVRQFLGASRSRDGQRHSARSDRLSRARGQPVSCHFNQADETLLWSPSPTSASQLLGWSGRDSWPRSSECQEGRQLLLFTEGGCKKSWTPPWFCYCQDI